jgi:hypothetical protein
MKRSTRLWLLRSAIAIAILLVAFPLTFITTFLLLPLWSWIEERYGIESVGHSGPADWCFYVILVLWITIAVVIAWKVRRATGGRKVT